MAIYSFKNFALKLFVAIGISTVPLVATNAMALDVGTVAPDISLPGVKDPVKLADFKGKLVYVDFWASWCGPCKQSFPFMNAMQTKYKAQGFEIIAVNVDAKTTDATA